MRSNHSCLKLCLGLALVALFFSSLAFPQNALAAKSDAVCYTMTPSLTEAAYDYLDEVYSEKYPAMALRCTYGTDEDKANLKQLADQIMKNAGSDRNKVTAVIEWCLENIDYDANATAIPQDVFYDRKGSCIGYATLIVELLRYEGIPAVWGDGWRGDMKVLTRRKLYEELMFDGHAWLFVNLGGEWTMFDPLWSGSNAVTDRTFMASEYYFGTIEGISVTYPGMDLALAGGGTAIVYHDGRFLNLEDGEPFSENTGLWVSGLSIDVTAYLEGSGYSYADPSRSTSDMVEGELFRDGWFGYGSSKHDYAYENGVKANATILTYEGERYFFSQGSSYRVLAPEGSYWIRYGTFTVAPGFKGKTILHNWLEENVDDPECRITYKWAGFGSEDVGTISSDGTFTALSPGFYEIEFECVRIEDNASLTSGFMEICVGDKPVPNYSSRGESASSIPSERLAGGNALDTMSAIVNAGGFKKGGTVVLASLEGYWDALTAAGIAGLEDAPVLMVLQDQLGDQTAAQLKKLAPSKIVVCGGSYWIPDRVVEDAKKLAGTNPEVVRYAGNVAVNTAEKIADAGATINGGWSDTAIIATVGTFQDALAAAPVSYAKKMPIYLAQFDFAKEKGSLAKSTIDSMKKNGITKAYIAGGTYWLPASIEKQLSDAGITVVKRLAGATAVETSAAIAKEAVSALGFSADSVGLADVAHHYDALASAAFCGRNNMVLLLVSDANRSSINSFVGENAETVKHVYVFGGKSSVSPDTVAAVGQAVEYGK